MGEVTREDRAAMTDRELLAYEREHHGDPYMTLVKAHGSESPNARANPERDDYIRAAARRVAQRLAALDQHDTALEGVDGQPGEHR
jgi:hypothetical protein